MPNQGAGTAGYVPAKNVTICWRSCEQFPELGSQWRVAAGIQTGGDTRLGQQLGIIVGETIVRLLRRIRA